MITLTLILFAIGTTYNLEDATATNVTVTRTADNRVRYDTVTFTDGLSCKVPSTMKEYTFNTAADAMAAIQLPLQTKRGYQYLKLTSDECVALTTFSIRESLVFIIFSIAGPVFDFILCTMPARINRWIRRRALNAPVVIPRNSTVAPAPPPPQGPSVYAATLMLEAAIQRGDTCPVTLVPLKTATLIVPACGHILSEAGRPSNGICPVCRQPAAYTSIPCSITVEPATVEPV